MLKKAKQVLERHLKRLQQIEKEQMEQMAGADDNDDDTEGEESEDDEDDEDDIPGTNYGITSSHALPKPSGSSPGTHGPFKYGNALPTKEQILEQYDKVRMFRAKQFDDMEKRLDNNEDKQNLNKERIAFFRQLEYQRDQQLSNLNLMIEESKQGRASVPSQEDEEAFKIDDDEGEAEEEEEEQEVEDSQEVENSQEVDIENDPAVSKQFKNQPNLIDVEDSNDNQNKDNQYQDESIEDEKNPNPNDEQDEDEEQEEDEEEHENDEKAKNDEHDQEILSQLYDSSDGDKDDEDSDPDTTDQKETKEKIVNDESVN